MMTNLSPKIPKIFICKNCDYLTSNKKDYNKHCSTLKHKMMTNDDNLSPKIPRLNICECGKIYKYRQGLHVHKKICNYKPNKQNNTTINNNNNNQQYQFIKDLIKDNKEMQNFLLEQNQQIIELAKNTGPYNTINNNNFNLNFYLKETCKNAMNIMDFVSQLQIGIAELEETGRLGYAEGISKIFINGLKQINVTDRPIHCSDMKRETLYIKNNDEWNKDTEHKHILTNAIKQISDKNIKQIFEWTKTHPNYKNSASKENDKYLRIVSESMSGSTNEETNKNYNKIIRNIVKETLIQKNM